MCSERDSRDVEREFVYRDGNLPDRAALEEVLRETLAAEQADSLQPAELDALLAVARRYPGAALTKEPIAAELVESILRLRLAGLDATPERRWSVARAIADFLCETPTMRNRLDGLWQRLSEAAI